MSETRRIEGGPHDGLTVVSDATVIRMVLPVPVTASRDWLSLAPVEAMPSVEYRRSGRVYRWPGLVDDARAEMRVSAELLAEQPRVRHEVRRRLRRDLERLAASKGQVVDRIVWVVGLDRVRSEVTVAAVVGGRRSEFAARRRAELRDRFGAF